MKEKLKSYDFWMSVASAVMVFLQTLSIKINVPYVNEITMAFLSLLAVTGILKKSGKQTAVNSDGATTETEDTAETVEIFDTQENKEMQSEETKTSDDKNNRSDIEDDNIAQ